MDEAIKAIRTFLHHYNHRRAHMGIDGFTPADRFQGRWEEIRDKVEAASRRRQGAAALFGDGSDPFLTEESLPGGPAEILRFTVFEGRMTLHFLGHGWTWGR